MGIKNPVITSFSATTGWTQALASPSPAGSSKGREYLRIQNLSGGLIEIGFGDSAPTIGEFLADGSERIDTGDVPTGAVWIKGAQAGSVRIGVVQ